MVLAKLKKMSDFYNFNEPTAVDFARDALAHGLAASLGEAQDVEPDAHESDRPRRT